MSKFKVGDVVVGNVDANKYGVTKEGWVGTVTLVEGTGFYARGKDLVDYHLDDSSFNLLSSASPVKSKAVTSDHSKCFMEDIQIRINDYCSDYYDGMTEDYIGSLGTILQYIEFDSVSGSWLAQVRMEDGEILEVLECEMEGYTTSKSSPGFVSYSKVGAPTVQISKSAYAPPKPPILNGVKIFDLTPKKKKRKSIFQSQ